jgi:hypothetical protein
MVYKSSINKEDKNVLYNNTKKNSYLVLILTTKGVKIGAYTSLNFKPTGNEFIETTKFDDKKIYNAEIINIHLFSLIDYTSNPITITFDYSQGFKKVGKILIIIGSFILLIIIVVVGLYYFLKNKILNQNLEKIRDNRIKILLNQFSYRIDDNNNNRQICYNCQEEIHTNDIISKTLCNHIFHSSCLEDYFRRNDLRCPICSFIFGTTFNGYNNNLIQNPINEETNL